MSVATARRSKMNGVLIVTALAVGFASLLIGPIGCGSEPEESSTQEAVESSEKRVQLNLGVDDRTDARPPSDQLAIKAPGHDLWQPELSHGGASRLFDEYPAGEEYELYVYPEGEDGPRLVVPFSMKADMMSGMASSKTYVEIYDDRIVVNGPAIPDGSITLDRPASTDGGGGT